MNAYAILTSGCEGVNLHFHPPNLSRIVGVGQDVILVPFCYRCLHQYVTMFTIGFPSREQLGCCTIHLALLCG